MKITLKYKLFLLTVFLTFSLTVRPQRIFYAPRVANWKTTFKEDTSRLLYTVFLIGDLKNYAIGVQTRKLLRHYMDKAGKNSTVVVLGDIDYPFGLPDSTDKGYPAAKRNLTEILHTFDHYPGKVYFIPGNHDWAQGRKQGWESVKNEERFIEKSLHRGNVFLPDGGCPGPVEVALTPDITLVIFDSQWWFQQNAKPGKNGECGFTDKGEIFLQIEDALKRNQDKKVIFVAHHPLYSVGEHGGYFPAYDLLFPLLDFYSWAYIPLPGFIYVGYRKYLGDIQDFAHPVYKEFRKTMLSIFKRYPDVIYAAGHEHNLEYISKDSLFHIISGAGGKATYIARKPKKADFACQCSGFNQLSFYANGDVVMKIIRVDSSHAGGKLVFAKKLFTKPVFHPQKADTSKTVFRFPDSIRVRITNEYEVGKCQRFMMGDNYRNIWDAKVTLPVFNISKEKGGLTIIKRGGGMQTRSVRLKDKNGHQYVLRSVNKYVDKALPEYFRNTLLAKPVQDAISASHPFAAVTLPPMAHAIGVMHTHPKIFWVPDDPNLGVYRDELANGAYLFEERPAGNWQNLASFGFSKNIVSTAKVVKKTEKDHHHFVDQPSVVKARLFDMLINDWDRHDDQWRWASFKNDDKTTYRPIPRDRDQAYFSGSGVIFWLARRKWLMPKFQNFEDTIKNIAGLNYNARYFDRSFLTQLSLNDWLNAAHFIQKNLTDSVIRQGLLKMPKNIYDSTGTEIENKLKARRNDLDRYAREYYRILAKDVDVTGTNKREFFDVKRENNGNTEVSVFAMSRKKGKIKNLLYHRQFNYDETKEIRLYGLGGKDLFKVTGTGDKGIKIRIIGGKGNDSIIDRSSVKGLGKKTIVYDRKDKHNFIQKGPETRLQLSKNKSVNTYNRRQFKYDKTMPLLWAGYNIDDGVFLGGGVKMNHYNFRDSTIQKIEGRIAFQTGAFAIKYQGLFTAVSRSFDLYINADLSFPRSVDNYFGLGNETVKKTDDKKYYRVRYKYARINPMLRHVVSPKIYYGFGLFYQHFTVTDTAGRFIGSLYPQTLDSAAYSGHNYVGINALFNIDTRDNRILPQSGIYWKTEMRGYYSLESTGNNFIKTTSDLRFYVSFRKDPRVVFALRVGGAVNWGDYDFYYANFLGGKTNLRGFRSNRFAGDYSFYQNTDIRFKITNINTYILNGEFGIVLFNDVGRVWVNNESSKKWHDGYGAGLWLIPFKLSALTLNYNRSAEDSFITFSFNYLF
ncbi:BamA/TamA family outer membrane protein [Candidatus Sulfidibacterium hydrothermale]|uniref:BamA/TamA family outer membrane protein n=1 Tax=Candidatus Sulfidibacterium hydrothermale TaxID=2875962 RepID=UPI001F0A2272|nr:BamA/TamA family outer membrane protein [Candidatus Sulfidibacterium hydrothermale]UBM61159.1 BamA/TamA family outer membrane protein [Candidatus Sulfidibacterium hydrothermale]